MTIQLSTSTRNGMLDSIESIIGTAAKVEVKTGSPPATCASANSGTVLVSYTLASDWAAAASAGAKSMNNLPVSGTAANTGTAGHFRIFSSSGTCHMQGTVASSGGDMTIDNTSVVNGQVVNITSFTIGAGNS